MPDRTPSQLGRYKRSKGNDFQRATARALRPWFPDCKSGRDNGFRTATSVGSDAGDLAGAGAGLWWSLKNVQAAVTEPDGLIGEWMREARDKAGFGTLPLLVCKRKGHSDPLESWAWVWLQDVVELSAPYNEGPTGPPDVPVRMALRHLLALLVAGNYALDPDRQVS